MEDTSFNPKLGVRWDVNKATQLRAAAFKVLKPSLYVNSRHDRANPGAGFNQFFDDATGTKAWRYGAAIDVNPERNLSWGTEFTWRDLELPRLEALPTGSAVTGTIDQDEQLHRVYINWMPTDRLAITAEAVYDRFKEPDAKDDDARPVPAEVQRL